MQVARKRNQLWLVLLLFVVGSNILIYQTKLSEMLGIHHTPQVVIGSLIDILLVAPLLLCLYLRKINWKMTIALFASASILATLAIPKTLLAPYTFITNLGIAMEVCILAFELLIIVIFLSYMPKIINFVKLDMRPIPFSFNDGVEKFTSNPIIKVLSSEILVFYYAFFSWKKRPMEGISIHKNSSYIAMQVMLLHAIVLESLGFHWWLHSKAPILSVILLLLNAYGFIFILADLQAMRLNRIYKDEKGLYVSFGLMKHTYIEFEQIEEVITEESILRIKKQTDCVEFVCRDFEEVFPQVLLKMKNPQTVRLMYGFKKQYRYVAIKCDDANTFIKYIKDEVEL